MKCSSKHTIPIIFMAKIQNQALNFRVMTLAQKSFSVSITSFSCSPRYCYFCQIPGYFLIQMEKKNVRKKEGVKRKQQPYEHSLLHIRNHSFFPLSNGPRGGGRVGQWILGVYDNKKHPEERPQTHTVLRTLEQHLKSLVTEQGRTNTGRKPSPW